MSGAVLAAESVAADKAGKSPDGSGSMEGGDGGDQTCGGRHTQAPVDLRTASTHREGMLQIFGTFDNVKPSFINS